MLHLFRNRRAHHAPVLDGWIARLWDSVMMMSTCTNPFLFPIPPLVLLPPPLPLLLLRCPLCPLVLPGGRRLPRHHLLPANLVRHAEGHHRRQSKKGLIATTTCISPLVSQVLLQISPRAKAPRLRQRHLQPPEADAQQ